MIMIKKEGKAISRIIGVEKKQCERGTVITAGKQRKRKAHIPSENDPNRSQWEKWKGGGNTFGDQAGR